MPHKDPQAAAAYFKTYRERNHEKILVYDRQRNTRADRKSLSNGIHRRKYHKYPEHERDRRLQKNFGISLQEYNQLLVKQHGVCAICHSPESRIARGKSTNYLAVDHDHATGQIRGLLCANCNTALGLFADTPTRCRAAANYLENYIMATYPEKDRSSEMPASPENGPGYIRSSQSVGAGHNDGDHLAPFSNEEFPNEESGIGKDPSQMDSPFAN